MIGHIVSRTSCCALALGALIVPGSAAPPPATAVSDLTLHTNQELGLRQSTVVALDVAAAPGAPLVTAVPLEGVPQVLLLEPSSVRAEGFTVLEQRAGGELVAVDPPPARTLRGTVLGVEGSVVAASALDGGLQARILYPDGAEYWIEPIAGRVAGAAAADHVVYAAGDVLDTGATCAATLRQHGVDLVPPAPPDALAGAGGACIAQLACDADFEYFQAHGGSTVTDIEDVINAVNLQYESEVGITHSITTIIVRTTSNDPYSKKKADQLLNEFRNEWETNQSGVVRDLAQLFTGRDLAGTTIGIAWIGAVCTNFGYSLVESDFDSAFACKTDLSAHEMGHNWGADHCSCSSFTMNAFITCANTFHPTATIPEIIAHRDSRTCLDNCGGVTPTGACCVGETCTVETTAGCAAAGGTYQGDGTDCAPNPCLTGGATDLPITGGTVQKGTLVSGFLEDLFDSDDGYVVIDARKQGPKWLSELRVFLGSPVTSASQLDVTTEVGLASGGGVTTTVELRNYATNQWDEIDSYAQPLGDTIRVNADVANPGDYIANDGEVTVRISTLSTSSDHVVNVDHVEVLVTP